MERGSQGPAPAPVEALAPGGRVVVIGGGVGGAAAALALAKRGAAVTLVERSPALGGLVVSLDVNGTPIERFYHHIFPHESEIIGLIDEMGLTPKLEWFPSSVGNLEKGRLWPFTTPVDLLRFGPLKPIDRVRSGIGALRIQRCRDWERLDQVSARDWLARLCGPRAAETVFEPLLRAKFGSKAHEVPAAWMWGRMQQRSGARGKRGAGTERLGYLRGGFRQLFDALEKELVNRGVDLRLDTAVDRILVGPGPDGRWHAAGVAVTAGGTATAIDADQVVYAGTLPGLGRLLPDLPADEHDPRWSAIGAMGALCVVVELRRRITDTYWVNVGDPDLPLTAYIEHTNLVPVSDYGGRHVAYMARYYTADDPLAEPGADLMAEAQRWVAALAGGGLPGFSADDVVALHPSRATYSAPLVTLGHFDRIPPVRSHVAGLSVVTTAQIYPQDRGMSEAVRMGTGIAEAIIRGGPGPRSSGGPGIAAPVADPGWECPVCGGRTHQSRWKVGEGTEGGVDAEAFRPSSGDFGRTAAVVVTCRRCGHGSLGAKPSAAAVAEAYEDAADPVSLREEAGQVETARRAFARIAPHLPPATISAKGLGDLPPRHRLLDIGCWTGSLLVAAREQNWDVVGVEPSTWASERARQRGLDVRTAEFPDTGLEGLGPGSLSIVAICDVLEHLDDPGAALDAIHDVLVPGGALYLTVPDAGSRLARLMGRRWWSVLPMHIQYFTRPTMRRLLREHGFDVRHEATHAKVFTARYYAERLAGYGPGLGELAVRALEKTGQADRPVAPDFGDRLEVLAVRS